MTAPVIMLIGKTHSGKTTFGRLLKERVPDLVILEADPIAIFLRENFGETFTPDDKEHTGKFENISLKFLLFKTIFERALHIDKPLILSNSNMFREGRRMLLEKCRESGRHVVGIFFDLPLDILKERTAKSERDIRVLRTSRFFPELLEKQARRMQEPDSSEFDEFYILHGQTEYDAMIESLAKRL